MNKEELCEFLAWVQDNYTEHGEEWYDVNEIGAYTYYTREEVVTRYLTEVKGGDDAQR